MALSFPEIDPVAFSLGPLSVRWYALAYLAGIFLGWRYALSLVNKDKFPGFDRDVIDDFMTWAIAGVIFGGRLGYVLFYNFSFYAANPLEIFILSNGGMSFHGGLLGVMVAMVVFSKCRKLHLLRLSDIVCCAVPIGLFFGRIANFVNAELYGRPSDVPWAVVFPSAPDDLARHPSQLYEAGLEGLCLFGLLASLVMVKALRDRPGILTGVFLAGYGASRFIVEYFREPDAQLGFVFAGFSMGQLLCVPMILAGMALWLYALRRAEQPTPAHDQKA